LRAFFVGLGCFGGSAEGLGWTENGLGWTAEGLGCADQGFVVLTKVSSVWTDVLSGWTKVSSERIGVSVRMMVRSGPESRGGAYVTVSDGSVRWFVIPTSCDVGYKYNTVSDGSNDHAQSEMTAQKSAEPTEYL